MQKPRELVKVDHLSALLTTHFEQASSELFNMLYQIDTDEIGRAALQHYFYFGTEKIEAPEEKHIRRKKLISANPISPEAQKFNQVEIDKAKKMMANKETRATGLEKLNVLIVSCLSQGDRFAVFQQALKSEVRVNEYSPEYTEKLLLKLKMYRLNEILCAQATIEDCILVISQLTNSRTLNLRERSALMTTYTEYMIKFGASKAVHVLVESDFEQKLRSLNKENSDNDGFTNLFGQKISEAVN